MTKKIKARGDNRRALFEDKMKKVVKFNSGICATLIAFLSVGCIPAPHEDEITVYMPDGAPALSMAHMMANDCAEDGVTYLVTSANKIPSTLTNFEMEKNADLCILPLTAAAKLVGSGEDYTMLGGVTHGNLYLVSKTRATLSLETMGELIGKKIGVLQMQNVPGLTLKVTLEKHGLSWSEMTNEGGMYEDTVNLVAISGPEAVGGMDADYFLLGEPSASAQAGKGYKIVGDLQALYGGEEGYPQAVLVVKNTLLAEREDWVKNFVLEVSKGKEWLQKASGAKIVDTISAHMQDPAMVTSLKASFLTQEVIARCSIRFVYAVDCKDRTKTLLEEYVRVQANATAIPSETFYWSYHG